MIGFNSALSWFSRYVFQSIFSKEGFFTKFTFMIFLSKMSCLQVFFQNKSWCGFVHFGHMLMQTWFWFVTFIIWIGIFHAWVLIFSNPISIHKFFELFPWSENKNEMKFWIEFSSVLLKQGSFLFLRITCCNKYNWQTNILKLSKSPFLEKRLGSPNS